MSACAAVLSVREGVAFISICLQHFQMCARHIAHVFTPFCTRVLHTCATVCASPLLLLPQMPIAGTAVCSRGLTAEWIDLRCDGHLV
jgi:hypothetical protein